MESLQIRHPYKNLLQNMTEDVLNVVHIQLIADADGVKQSISRHDI